MESAENQVQPNSNTESKSNISPTFSKTETIALLNDSIDRLEETIKRLSEDSAKIPSSDSIKTLLTTTQALEDAVTPVPEIKVPQAESVFQTQQGTAIPQPVAQKTTKPASAKTSVPKAQKKNLGLMVIVVTAIAIAIVTVFWLWKPEPIANLFSKAESVPKTAVNLDSIADRSPANPLIDSPENLDSPLDNTSVSDFPAEIEPIAEPIEDVVKTNIPPELTSPGKPKNLKMVTIKPELLFTPEQNFIAALETKLETLVQDYPSELIQNIQVNFPDNSLLIEVTDNWYELDELKQNSLGNEILQRSRALSFNKLELKDKLGTLIARNPIIGDNIIILQSKKQQLSENLG
ncbi:hypothetical protein C7B62_09445 [Pleurocapsa sp. CCALA 161]|uniref:hypothetical protein n=1 Tax=Pleurocapsa sp. CCALA 161 TaxID=2107688 RepID=UPI000D057E73|nr:hypothetical protein [Pleurocapsa sp. CCALA 161]PSB10453.1 hypothetical protein C7B62_09445 [Pleurocapsa sp. CCALA 161]